VPVKAKVINLDVFVERPCKVRELPASIELPVLSIVKVLLPPEVIKTTLALPVIVRLFIVVLPVTVIEELVLIITSSAVPGAPDGDQLPLVLQVAFPPIQVLVTP